MAAVGSNLEPRVRALETRTTRNEEDITALISTTSETLVRVRTLEVHVRRLERGVDAIAAHLGVEIPDEPDPVPDSED